jgi:hypothetical protein
MSFASRFTKKFTNSQTTAEPSGAEPVQPRTLIANNENGFIPTNFGEEIADAKKTFLPRNGAQQQGPQQPKVDIHDMNMFPSLGTVQAPKTQSGLHPQKKSGWLAATTATTLSEESHLIANAF